MSHMPYRKLIISGIVWYTLFCFLRRLGGASPTEIVSRILYHLFTDGVAVQYSLRGATRRGVAKRSFEALGILSLIKDLVWSTQKTVSSGDIEEAVGDHLRHAVVRERRKAHRAANRPPGANPLGPLNRDHSIEGDGAADDEDDDEVEQQHLAHDAS